MGQLITFDLPDDGTFTQRNAPHDAGIAQAIALKARFGIDAEQTGQERLPRPLILAMRQAARDGADRETRYFPDLKCRVRATRLAYYCEVKTALRHDTGNWSVEWDCYTTQAAMAETGARILWLFEAKMAAWIQDVDFCSPVIPGAPGRTDFRLISQTARWLRPWSDFAREEFGCSPIDS